jgi:tetratricopeptide (TPR) repeat protein
MRKIGSVFIFILATATAQVYAQADSCILKLKNAATFFDEGNYDNTIQLLKSALGKCNLDREDKFQAYKLLALSYIRVDNLEEADNTAAAIMKMDPYYKPINSGRIPRCRHCLKSTAPRPLSGFHLAAG